MSDNNKTEGVDYVRECKQLEGVVAALERQLRRETTVIDMLLAMKFVSQAKVEQVRDIVNQLEG